MKGITVKVNLNLALRRGEDSLTITLEDARTDQGEGWMVYGDDDQKVLAELIQSIESEHARRMKIERSEAKKIKESAKSNEIDKAKQLLKKHGITRL